jgi:branched-chain amino acid aminotransferase
MEPTPYIWHRGSLVPWAEANVHVLTHTLHYGGGCFEGIRAYETPKGAAVFRLKEHVDRLFYSAGVLKMELAHSRDEVSAAILELLAKNQLESAYIRPLVYYGYGVMGLNPRNAPTELSIAAWRWGAYLPHEMVDVKISDFIRIHPRSTVADAKICGHYVNSMLAVLALRGTPYHEALFLDADGRIAEGPGENFFIVKNGEIHTPPLGTILAGITRNTIFTLAGDLGYRIVERELTPDDAWSADEAFFTGTAAEVTLIRSLDDKPIGSGTPGPVSSAIKKLYLETVTGKRPEYDHFLSYVG